MLGVAGWRRCRCNSLGVYIGSLCLRDDVVGVGHSSGTRALCYKSLDPPAWRIDPALQVHLQFGLFSVPTSGPQMVHQSLGYVLSVRKCI